jgi:hypothetical protein
VKTRGYQILLAAAIGVCVLLAIALGYVLLRRDHAAPQTTAQDPVVARGPEMPIQALRRSSCHRSECRRLESFQRRWT